MCLVLAQLWDVRSCQLMQHYPAHSDQVTSISIHASGNYILSASADSSMKIWDIREGRLLYTIQGHTGPILSAAFSPNGEHFASGGADAMVMVWKSNLNDCEADDARESRGTSTTLHVCAV
jgi:centriolar protein POC1